MPLSDFLHKSCSRFPNKVALICDDRPWTYTDLDQITDHLAASLIQIGVQAGDRVALHLPNCPELVFSYFACFKLGAIAVPLVPLFKGPELEYILNHCEAKVCISHEKNFAELHSVRANLPHLQHCFLVSEPAHFPQTQPFAALLEGQPERVIAFAPINDEAPAAILYTSGTTARPKGVTHTHYTLQKTVAYDVACIDLRDRDVLVGMLALTHIFGFSLQLLTAISVGATLVILRQRDTELLLLALQRYKATKLYGLPVMFAQLVDHPSIASYDLSSLDACFVGGDAVAIALHERCKQMLGLELTEGCGMTEVIPYSVNPPFGEKRLGSIGRAIPGMNLRLVNPLGTDVPQGDVGEIWVQSDAVMLGYWNNPQATAAVLQDGWLQTGDLAYQDPDGYYWFVGRQKEIIVRGGSTISPLEVEAALYQHPSVREAAVVGVPDANWGEVVWAYVALYPDSSITEAKLQAFVAERLADHKVPAAIAFLPDLPKGLTGKIHRKTLKDMATEVAVKR
jgi:long-chain acyl-CoA synthetase